MGFLMNKTHIIRSVSLVSWLLIVSCNTLKHEEPQYDET